MEVAIFRQKSYPSSCFSEIFLIFVYCTSDSHYIITFQCKSVSPLSIYIQAEISEHDLVQYTELSTQSYVSKMKAFWPKFLTVPQGILELKPYDYNSMARAQLPDLY